MKRVFPVILAGCAAISLIGLAACKKLPFGIVENEPASSDHSVIATQSPNSVLNLEPKSDVAPLENVDEIKSEPIENSIGITLYYITDDGYLLPVKKNIKKQDGIAMACLTELTDNPNNHNELIKNALRAPIPFVKSIGISIVDGEAIVDLIEPAPIENADLEEKMYTAIVNTLVSLDTINCVSVRINGSAEKTANGIVPPVKRGYSPINVENTALATSIGAKAVTLYFPNSSGSVLVPTTRYLESDSIYSIVNALAAGTGLSDLISCFPENTLILGATVENGILSINCSSDFKSISNKPMLYDLLMQSVLLSTQSKGSIDEIHFLINGTLFAPEW